MGRRTNLALAVLVSAAFVTGVAGFLLGGSRTGLVLVVHGVAGLAIVLLVPWKTIVVRRGLRRHRPDSWLSVGLAVAVVAAVASGVVHSVGIWQARGIWSAMGLHIGAALMVVPLFGWHLRARPQWPRRADLSRRAVVRGVAVVGGALAVRAVTRDDLRFTGSHEIGSFRPAEMPVVQWLDDSPPSIPLDGWALVVGDRQVGYDELLERSEEVVAALDCTGGWYSTQWWRGVRVGHLLGPDRAGRSIEIVSATGYGRRFPIGDADHLLLATHVGDEPLSQGHGFPVRLVAPSRRGFWWVKWVVAVRTSDRPWWLQSPVPFT